MFAVIVCWLAAAASIVVENIYVFAVQFVSFPGVINQP